MKLTHTFFNKEFFRTPDQILSHSNYDLRLFPLGQLESFDQFNAECVGFKGDDGCGLVWESELDLCHSIFGVYVFFAHNFKEQTPSVVRAYFFTIECHFGSIAGGFLVDSAHRRAVYMAPARRIVLVFTDIDKRDFDSPN